MQEKRAFNRWYLAKDKTAVVSCGDIREEAKILDISAGGMKISFSQPLDIGATISGDFTVIPNIPPFSVQGTVKRVREIKGAWEIAVKFDKITGQI